MQHSQRLPPEASPGVVGGAEATSHHRGGRRAFIADDSPCLLASRLIFEPLGGRPGVKRGKLGVAIKSIKGRLYSAVMAEEPSGVEANNGWAVTWWWASGRGCWGGDPNQSLTKHERVSESRRRC